MRYIMTQPALPGSNGHPDDNSQANGTSEKHEPDQLPGMNFVDILVSVDTIVLAQMVLDRALDPGTPDDPTYLGSYSDSGIYIMLTTQGGYCDNNQAGDHELQVKAKKGSWLRFSLTPFDNNIAYSAYLYAGVFSPQKVISPMRYLSRETRNYFPPTDQPTASPLPFANQTCFGLAGITGGSQIVQCSLSFAMISNQSGAAIGYFCWDSFLRIV